MRVRDLVPLIVGISVSSPVLMVLVPGFYSRHGELLTALWVPAYGLGLCALLALFLVAAWGRIQGRMPEAWHRAGRPSPLEMVSHVIAAGLVLSGLVVGVQGSWIGWIALVSGGMLFGVLRWGYAGREPAPIAWGSWAEGSRSYHNHTPQSVEAEGALEDGRVAPGEAVVFEELPPVVAAARAALDAEYARQLGLWPGQLSPGDLPEICPECGAENEWIELVPPGGHQVEGTNQVWSCPVCWRKKERERLVAEAEALGGRVVFGEEG